MEGFLLVIPLVVIIAIGIRLAAGGLDHERVSSTSNRAAEK